MSLQIKFAGSCRNYKNVKMSDSEDLSDLEAQQSKLGEGSDDDEQDKTELKGILNDVEETSVSWKDLVSF